MPRKRVRPIESVPTPGAINGCKGVRFRPQFYAACRLFAVDGKNCRDIAAELKVSEWTVHKWLQSKRGHEEIDNWDRMLNQATLEIAMARLVGKTFLSEVGKTFLPEQPDEPTARRAKAHKTKQATRQSAQPEAVPPAAAGPSNRESVINNEISEATTDSGTDTRGVDGWL